MQASRLLSILMILQLRGRVSAEALAEEFEVSVRTIYRDIDQLSAAGVPVYGERGRSGGFQLDGSYRTQLTGMTPAQADALMLAGAGQAAEALG
jgi:predicted DNA-binding transcriptional regulator YafY